MLKCAIGHMSRTDVFESPPVREGTVGEKLPRCHRCTGMSPEQLFLAHLGVIERLIARHCSRYHLRREEAEDFASWVKLKLIDNGYRVFREYKGKSTIETYLTVVVQRLALDHLDQLWGKWRPSAEAKRLGALAILIERLQRDGHSPDEFCAILRTNFGVEETSCELETIASRLPQRAPRRRFEGEERLSTLQASDASPEQLLDHRERAAALGRVLAALDQALIQLSPEDRAVAQLRGSLKIAEIARLIGQKEKPFYRQVEKILRTLRQAMELKGVHAEDIREVLGGSA
jgi:RNA polymerase sigma factor (sigma-70 family)